MGSRCLLIAVYSKLSLNLIVVVMPFGKSVCIIGWQRVRCLIWCSVSDAIWAFNFNKPKATTVTADEAIR